MTTISPPMLSRLSAALRRDAVGGLLLIAAAVIALGWANSPYSGTYEALRALSFGPSAWHLHLSVQQWASDGLLAIFFFIVGNELKQEFTHGDLRHPRRALLPMVAALCGVLVPAALFAAITWGSGEAARGWGIPMATDAPFAVAVLAVIGRHLPAALRTFLLTLAVVDDLVAIIVIAAFYPSDLSLAPLAGALALLALFGYLQRGHGPLAGALTAWQARTRAAGWVIYTPLALAIWALMHASGIHATIAGAAMGLLMRTRPLPGRPDETGTSDQSGAVGGDPSHRAEQLLRPVTMGLVLPLFALASAGVALDNPSELLSEPVALGVLAGLLLGKSLGIAGGAYLTAKLTRAELHPSLAWTDIIGMALLAGIGFTVSLLISELAYPGHPGMLEHVKGAVLIASALATVLASTVLIPRNAHYRDRPPGPSSLPSSPPRTR
ncbi:Na+/H+ antiporter NhaA [Nonomuraea sp. KC401]|uniref:Na+/H+ antiporter NhaA n=1 Tax=unclassified Nonomuraea TaxID=2593643 RepID=UPI0010FD0B97|nr:MULTISPECIES: Na+/H+ antiporter NhaA [unclassified Nonomuraea]NBE97220.1 Na+/H+ antiporter NhaA [Nonomuraea sp. K271]TLF65917.1 Na+/H+ antiporter NhaA [Nonomuraea sp. KC401]